jgi:hypothetical protein
MVGVPRVLSLGREREEEILAANEAILLENRFQNFDSSARIGGGFQDHELAAPQVSGDGTASLLDETQIRLALARERCRHTDQDRVGRREIGCCWSRAVAPGELGADLAVDMFDVASPRFRRSTFS